MLQGAHSFTPNEADGGPEFAEVFVIIWLGASVVTLNSKLLGGTMYGRLSSLFISPLLFYSFGLFYI